MDFRKAGARFTVKRYPHSRLKFCTSGYLEIWIFKEQEKIAQHREKPSVQGRKATYDTKPQSDDWRKASAYPTMALQPTYTLKFEFENFQSDYCH